MKRAIIFAGVMLVCFLAFGKTALFADSLAEQMLEYEQYGLQYNEEQRGDFFDGKLVGLFIDRQGVGVIFLHLDGGIHVRAVRDENGRLTGLAELGTNEYNDVIAGLGELQTELQNEMETQLNQLSDRLGRIIEDVNESIRRNAGDL